MRPTAPTDVALATVLALAGAVGCSPHGNSISVPVVITLESESCGAEQPEFVELGCANHVRISLSRGGAEIDSFCEQVDGATLADIEPVLAAASFGELEEGQTYSLLIEVFEAESCESPNSFPVFVGQTPPTLFAGDNVSLLVEFTCLPQEPMCEDPMPGDQDIEAEVIDVESGVSVEDPNQVVAFGSVDQQSFVELTPLEYNGAGLYVGQYFGSVPDVCPATSVDSALGPLVSCQSDMSPMGLPLSTTGFTIDGGLAEQVSGALTAAGIPFETTILGHVESINGGDRTGFTVESQNEATVYYRGANGQYSVGESTGPSGMFAIVPMTPDCCVTATANNGQSGSFEPALAPSLFDGFGYMRILVGD